MRYAIVSDLHANLAAWQTVLTDLADLGAERIICLGDVVGYGPSPVEVLESVYRVASVTLLGNHDAAACGRISADIFTRRAAMAVARHQEQLARNALTWLAQLPLTYEGPGFRCAHSDFSDPAAFLYVSTPDEALASWKAAPEQLLFVGHTHQPGIFVIGASGAPHAVSPCDFELEEGKRYLVNPGSVGYPRAGDRRSSYCIYDDATRTILFRQLPFDSAAYRHAMRGVGLDDDSWVQQKAAQQCFPALREAPDFRSPNAKKLKPKSRGRARHHVALVFIAGAAVVAGGAALFRAGRAADAQQTLAIEVPAFELPMLAAYPLTPLDRNLLPPLPSTLGADGRLAGWRYALEERGKQQFSIGLRDGATTLCVASPDSRRKMQLESPLIDLAGTGLQAVRLSARIRKTDAFDGTVFYQLVTYTAAADGAPAQQGVHPFEMRTAKRKLSTPGAERDVKIKLSKQTTHIRLRIEADFKGTLEIEQPRLTAETKETRQ